MAESKLYNVLSGLLDNNRKLNTKINTTNNELLSKLDIPSNNSTGLSGQFLTKTENGSEWSTIKLKNLNSLQLIKPPNVNHIIINQAPGKFGTSDTSKIYIDTKNNPADRSKVFGFVNFGKGGYWDECPEDGFGDPYDNSAIVIDISETEKDENGNVTLFYAWYNESASNESILSEWKSAVISNEVIHANEYYYPEYELNEKLDVPEISGNPGQILSVDQNNKLVWIKNSGSEINTLQLVKPERGVHLLIKKVEGKCSSADFLESSIPIYLDTLNNSSDRQKVKCFMSSSVYSTWDICPDDGFGTPYDNSPVIVDITDIGNNITIYYSWYDEAGELSDWHSAVISNGLITVNDIFGGYNDGGEMGPAGPQGEKGEKGDKGDKGDTGPQGERGIQGETGLTGPQGIEGLQGPPGPQGKDGPIGPQGIEGKRGPKGDKGDTGPQGAPGKDGKIDMAPITIIHENINGTSAIISSTIPIIGVSSPAPMNRYHSIENSDITIGDSTTTINFERYLIYENLLTLEPGWVAYYSGGQKGNDGSVSFDELSESQKLSLKGDQGIPGEKGPKGDTFKYNDMTPDEKLELQNEIINKLLIERNVLIEQSNVNEDTKTITLNNVYPVIGISSPNGDYFNIEKNDVKINYENETTIIKYERYLLYVNPEIKTIVGWTAWRLF